MWGYHLNSERWLKRLERWESAGVPLLNPVGALRWNTSKAYLADLEAAGVPVVPSVAVTQLGCAEIELARQQFDSDLLVAKPYVGACAHGTVLVRRGLSLPTAGAQLIQPYMASIATDGEFSLIYFNGRFSHAVRKLPAAGDFRVQAEHGGSVAPADPQPTALAVAEAALAAAPAGLCYARVDLVRDDHGQYRLIELELIEPQLFFNYAPGGAALLAAALRRLSLDTNLQMKFAKGECK